MRASNRSDQSGLGSEGRSEAGNPRSRHSCVGGELCVGVTDPRVQEGRAQSAHPWHSRPVAWAGRGRSGGGIDELGGGERARGSGRWQSTSRCWSRRRREERSTMKATMRIAAPRSKTSQRATVAPAPSRREGRAESDGLIEQGGHLVAEVAAGAGHQLVARGLDGQRGPPTTRPGVFGRNSQGFLTPPGASGSSSRHLKTPPEAVGSSYRPSGTRPEASGRSYGRPGTRPGAPGRSYGGLGTQPEASGRSYELLGTRPGASGRSYQRPITPPGASGRSFLLPLDRRRGFARDVVDDAVDPFDFVDDPVGHPA